jgi:hypothetical protein
MLLYCKGIILWVIILKIKKLPGRVIRQHNP